MTEQLDALAKALAEFWDRYAALIILGTGAVALALIIWALVRFAKTGDKSKVISTVAAVVVMVWTSEGLLQAAVTEFDIPWQFAGVAFFVFESMMLAAAYKAEENRKSVGVPGAAGAYVFVIAITSGIVAALGAENAGLVFLRIVLPPLGVGLWWVLLTSDRDSDTEEIKKKREDVRAAREATWAVTPTTVLVRIGLKKPGKTSTTQAQREHLRDRMVALADAASALPETSRWRRRKVARLRKLTRTADAELVAEVVEYVRRAQQAEALMVGGSTTGTAMAAPMVAESEVEDAAVLPLSADLADTREDPPVSRLTAEVLSPLPLSSDSVRPVNGHATVTLEGQDGDSVRPVNGHATVTLEGQDGDSVRPVNGRRSVSDAMPSDVVPSAVVGPENGVLTLPGASPAATAAGWAVELRMRVAELRRMATAGELADRTDAWCREDARDLARIAVLAGEPLAGAELGRLYGKDSRWGQRRANDARGHGAADPAAREEQEEAGR